MISKGYFIGQIIDELASVSHQLEYRSKLGLFDLNVITEDFIKNILNLVYDYGLINLNEDKNNFPGYDLGDEVKQIGFQITVTKNIEKIRVTLERAVKNKKKFPKLIILILTKKQNSYAMDNVKTYGFNFTEDDIWDMNDVLKDVLHLDTVKVQELHSLIMKETARVKIELEIPDQDGRYPTDINSHIEPIPEKKFQGLDRYIAFNVDISNDFNKKEALDNFNSFIKVLQKLPRITRQFYSFLIQRSEWEKDNKKINYAYLSRIYSYPDMKGEIDLLINAKLINHYEQDEEDLAYISLSNPFKEDFIVDVVYYMEEKDIDIDKAIVSLDFTDFH